MEEIYRSQIQHIFMLDMVYECLLIRLKMIRNGYADKNEYERNEVNLLKFETELKVAKIKNDIALNLTRFTDFYDTYLSEVQVSDMKDRDIIVQTESTLA
jgi:hypothetical protein